MCHQHNDCDHHGKTKTCGTEVFSKNQNALSHTPLKLNVLQ